MPQPMTLAVIGGLSLVGAAAGTWAGRAAIAEINPAYFGASEDRFHADRVPYRSPDWAQAESGGVEEVQLVQGLGDGCLTCGAPEILAAPPVVPALYSEQWVQDATAAAEPTAILVGEAEPDPEMERVQRYSSYPVSAEEAEAARQQPEAAAEEEVAGAEPEGL